MISIQTQDKNEIYYKPELEKLYISEHTSNFGLYCFFQVWAVIDGTDCLLGSYTDKRMAQKAMFALVDYDNCYARSIYSMPEDKSKQ